MITVCMMYAAAAVYVPTHHCYTLRTHCTFCYSPMVYFLLQISGIPLTVDVMHMHEATQETHVRWMIFRVTV